MKKNFIAAFVASIISLGVYAQENSFVQYQVKKGDTVSKIAREYGVSVSKIFEFNPEAKEGIKEGSFIHVPVKNEGVDQQVLGKKGKLHQVKPKETLYGISKQYNVSLEQLLQWNPLLKTEGLKAGSKIIVSKVSSGRAKDVTGKYKSELNYSGTLSSSKADTIKDITNIYYKYIDVEPQSTLYGLAVLYNTSIQRLIELNPELKQGLKSGQKIKVPAFGYVDKVVEITPVIPSDNISEYTTIKVAPKQTLYSISREYDLTITELVDLNPDLLTDGLMIGMKLKVPNIYQVVNVVEESTGEGVEIVSGYADLSTSLYKEQRREIALLLPFNVSRLGSNVESKLASDSFLNMTLDFYLGAKLAIAEAESLGLPLTVNVYDSNETKNSSAVTTLVSKGSFDNADIIVGPFFQANVAKLVNNLPNREVMVLSPLSNEKEVSSSQLVQSMPDADMQKKAMIDYFLQQSNVKLTVIIDQTRTSSRQFMSKYFSQVKVINSDALDNIDKTLVAGRKNVFILDSSSIEAANLLVSKLKRRVKDFDIQIGALDKGDVFDTMEVEFQSMIDLKYVYPSVTRDSSMDENSVFQEAYKTAYGVLPNRFAARGYDLMFDVIMRTFQKEGFKSTFKYATQLNENKFVYRKGSDNTEVNTGVYILQYTEDLTEKVVN
ncbi:LysM peptidoglycan-binding domain-containing protein [Myroides pelagicus]|uniref:LysM peptidoglycan-binding domain-containing protein n=1 Tax=Myroides pelagicus TaxID=270914 RepID=UPI002DBF93A6|nr:LysM peptidoglycan-binding domain-containing protein [Myroides pelagicus]MEC4113915.1 LysM peptidoglycan-binding domain-containing protein [Myroides pelagicus]